jgi:anthranilate phosphoribosyltransferase
MIKSLQQYIDQFQAGRSVDAVDTEDFLDAVLLETDENLLTQLLIAWETKGWSEDELFQLAVILRSRMKRVATPARPVVDIVGTGGSRVKTFNVSTAAAFVIAGAGLAVAKHGNRAATSNSGSVDVLAELGINVETSLEVAENCLSQIGLYFMAAPSHHSLSAPLARARKAFGRPTIFNSLGPICNPASARHQLIGVWHRDLIEKTARVISRLGTERTWVVHSRRGLDEIDLAGPTEVAQIEGDMIRMFQISPEDFGIRTVAVNIEQRLDAKRSSRMVLEVLEGKSPASAAEQIVLINAAAALVVGGLCSDLIIAYRLAERSVREGSALRKLEGLRAATNL